MFAPPLYSHLKGSVRYLSTFPTYVSKRAIQRYKVHRQLDICIDFSFYFLLESEGYMTATYPILDKTHFFQIVNFICIFILLGTTTKTKG